jgi:hypothetical protein
MTGVGSARSFVASAAKVEEVIRQRVTERADEWFPGMGPRPAVALRPLKVRPRAMLYSARVGTGRRQRRVIAKVRRGWPDADQEADVRPRLTPQFLGAPELTALEFAGLTSIFAVFGDGHPTFGAVRPLEHLAGEDTILMEHVDAPTLREVLMRSSRFEPRLRPSPRHRQDAWHRAGAWLRTFQRQVPGDGLPARQATREEVADRFEAFGTFLTRRLGARAAGDAARIGARLAADVLPPLLTLAVGHGDFAPRNVFLLRDGRVTVFDPLLRWQVPRVEDLARFLVAFRLQGSQLHTHGVTYSARGLDARERAVIEGYCGDGGVPTAELRCYQLLITLDKWSALIDSPSRGWSARLRHTSLQAAAGYVRAETRRLVELVDSA